MRNWPLVTRSPSFTAILMMRPVMSALMSTLVSASILPLAVTAATRSCRPTGSSRTSVALVLLAVRKAEEPPPDDERDDDNDSPSLVPRDMIAFLVSEVVGRPRIERGERLVIIVNRVDVVAFGPLHRVLRIRQLERGAAAEPVAVLRQPELLPRRVAAGLLHGDGLIGRLERQEAPLHIGPYLEPAGPHAFLGVILAAPAPGPAAGAG